MKFKVFKTLSIAFSISMFSYTQAVGQENINMDNYIDAVIHFHPQTKAAQSELNASVYEKDIAKMRDNPELSVQYVHNREDNIFNGPGVESEISIPIDWWNQRKSRINIAHAGLEQAQFDYKINEAELKQLARQIYIETWAHHKMEEVILESLASLDEVYKRDSIQFELGEISEFELKQAKIEKDKAAFDLLSFQQEKEDLEIVFATLMGARLNQYKPENIAYFNWSKIPDWETLNSELWLMQQKDWEIKEAEEELTLIKKERKVSPELIGGFEHNYLRELDTSDQFTEAKWKIGIGIPLPFSNRNKAELLQQQELIDKTRFEKQELTLSLKQKWLSTVNAYNKAVQKINIFENSILKDAGEWLSEMESAYHDEKVDWMDLVDAQRFSRELQLEYYENLLTLWEAMIQIQFWMEQMKD